MNERDLMFGILTKFFNKTDEELTEVLYDSGEENKLTLKEDALDVLVSMDTARVGRLRDDAKGDSTKKFDEGYKKAQKEVLGKFEKDFKEKFSFESDKTGLDLVAEWGEKKYKGSKLTLEDIKAHPEYLKIEKEKNEEWSNKVKTIQGEFEDYKNGVERTHVLNKVKDKAELAFLALNPALSEDKAKARRQTDLFLQKFDNYNYIFNDDGSTVIMDGDKRLEDGHGNPRRFDAFVKDEAEKLYDFRKQEDRDNSANETSNTDPSKRIITSKERNDMINAANGDNAKLAEISKNYTVSD